MENLFSGQSYLCHDWFLILMCVLPSWCRKIFQGKAIMFLSDNLKCCIWLHRLLFFFLLKKLSQGGPTQEEYAGFAWQKIICCLLQFAEELGDSSKKNSNVGEAWIFSGTTQRKYLTTGNSVNHQIKRHKQFAKCPLFIIATMDCNTNGNGIA